MTVILKNAIITYMEAQFDVEKLRKLANDFYNCTKLSVSVFDKNYQCFVYSDSGQFFCNKLRSDKKFVNYCKLSDETHFLQAQQTKKTVVFSCHAGITESVTPIFYENVIIAYIFLGRFRDKERVYSSKARVNRALKSYGLPQNEYDHLYKQLPCLSKQTFESALSILTTCIRDIWRENLIKLNKNMLPSKIENYILENLRNEITVDSICRKFFVSKKTLYSIFKDEFNVPVKIFINNQRFQAAKKLLKNTDLSVSAIADQVGFSDYNYFIRQFKKHTGLTPLQYRRDKNQML